MRLPRRIAQWIVCYIGLLLHGISFAVLLLRAIFGRLADHEEAPWLRNNAGLDFRDNDGLDSTSPRDGWDRIWRDWKRLPHDIKNLPHELFKSRPPKYAARLAGFLILVTLAVCSAAWALAWALST